MKRSSPFFIARSSLFAQPGTITTIADNYKTGFGLRATEVQLSRPETVTVGAGGNVFVGEASIHWIRRVAREGIVHLNGL